MVTRFLCTHPDQPWGPPTLLYNAYQVFPRGKAAKAWRWPHTPSEVEVKERVQQYLYSPSDLSGLLVIGWTLPLPFYTVYVIYNLAVSYRCHSYCCVTLKISYTMCRHVYLSLYRVSHDYIPQTVHYLLQLNSKPKTIINHLTLLLTYSHGAKPFLRSLQVFI